MPIKILLWSPKGSGLHYGGPGMTAYRMYGSKATIPFSLELCHGWVEQKEYDLFSAQHFIHDAYQGRMSQVSFIREGRRWLRDNVSRFDVFHGLQAFQMSVAAAWTAKEQGVPSFVKVASYQADLAGSRLSKLLGVRQRRIKMLRELTGVIAISSEIQQECLDCGVAPDRVHYIPNGVDVSHFRPLQNESERDEIRQSMGLKDLPTVTFAGVLVRRKRPHLLIHALKNLRDDHQLEVQLLLVGPENDSAYVSEMKEMITAFGLENHVYFMGMQSDVRPFLHVGDLFALPSMKEGLPNAALEALACGRPCVLTPMSGAADLLQKHLPCGMIRKPDQHDIAGAIAQYLNDDEMRQTHCKNARHNTETSFSSDSVLQRTLELFQEQQ